MEDHCLKIRQRAAHLFTQASHLKNSKIISVEPSPRNILINPSDVNRNTDLVYDTTLDEKYASSIFERTVGNLDALNFTHIQELSETHPLSKKRLVPVKSVENLLELSLPVKCVPEMNLWEPVFTELQSSTKIQRTDTLQEDEGSEEDNESINKYDEWLHGVELAFSLAEKIDHQWHCYLQHIQKKLLGINQSDTLLQEPAEAFYLSKMLLKLSQVVPNMSIYEVFHTNIDHEDPKISGLLRQFRADFEHLTSHEIRSKFLSTLKTAHETQDQEYHSFNTELSEVLKNMSSEVLQIEHHDSCSVYPIEILSIIPHVSAHDNVLMSFSGQANQNPHSTAHSCAALYSEGSEQRAIQLFFADAEHGHDKETVKSYFHGNLRAKATPGASKRYAIMTSQDKSSIKFSESNEKLIADANWPDSTSFEENTLIVEVV